MTNEAQTRGFQFSLGQLLGLVGVAAVGLAFAAYTGLEACGIVLLIWLIHAPLAAALSAPIVFLGRRRVRWTWLDVSALFLPFATWWMLDISDYFAVSKTMANLCEPLYLSFAIPCAAPIRAGFGNRVQQKVCSAVLVAGLCGVAAAIYFLVPTLPE